MMIKYELKGTGEFLDGWKRMHLRIDGEIGQMNGWLNGQSKTLLVKSTVSAATLNHTTDQKDIQPKCLSLVSNYLIFSHSKNYDLQFTLLIWKSFLFMQYQWQYRYLLNGCFCILHLFVPEYFAKIFLSILRSVGIFESTAFSLSRQQSTPAQALSLSK